MFSEFPAVPTLAVSDLARAREFYEGTLGLTARPPSSEGVEYTAGDGVVLVYESAYAGTNKATSAAFRIPADRFDEVVAHLRGHGVTFDTFEAEGLTWADGIASMTGMDEFKGAWFHDPDGNIIAIETGG